MKDINPELDSSATPQNDNRVFVSRGGIKLQAAIVNFQLSIVNLTVLDVGSSTGGFVDCLLQNGAKKVYALDTAYGELAWKLRNDPRVVVMERTNILRLEKLSSSVIPAPARIDTRSVSGRNAGIQLENSSSELDPRLCGDDKEKVDLVTIDAGWTKLELVLPVVKKFLKPEGKIIALLKPHYEAEKKDLVKGVLPENIAEQVKDQIVDRLQGTGYRVEKIMESPILGGAGNKEYLLFMKL
ncbi:hypothetical protein A3J19_01440 [Candidatus Daviesbacteria bacterium RIFCSPLOWO2_02_FULL_41_8]|uniref:Ribosomal RNA methyltransferase FtsJ domain-containing protein n=2 Tax=Candidatus Daviesiibacteriota TaxID=1752718 RepID=A0A1F5NHA9_9BACT|nr:MAG: hypothetical protein A2871_04335 [Candidatus Daviesbacteria bacterium RIFCSPHIGHO2_01_FULL_41_23]OGE62239.1 MAG: hypothetical protein A2967_02140 [Candidatus Daviesbacteria bacterium RIFCSPLOWO2_01_FULL_41_32]OGE77076.1 MAG: hypothetical protein A3J19_01440 [Candidatus Daviesbacteria bacterium RIFCSPLOWO2_02_FULL_41_8]